MYDEEWPINTDGQSVKHMMFDQTDHHQGEPLPPLPAPLRVTVDAPVVGQLAGEQGAADYKYYDTGMGLYNNFAYQGGVRHPEPEGNGYVVRKPFCGASAEHGVDSSLACVCRSFPRSSAWQSPTHLACIGSFRPGALFVSLRLRSLFVNGTKLSWSNGD